MSFTELNHQQKDFLLNVARQAIEHHLSGSEYEVLLPVDFFSFKEQAATFVTLKTNSGELRGCIGTLEAIQPLYLSVASNAVSAAFRDPRFPPIDGSEWPTLNLSISILSKAVVMDISSEEDLKQQLRPGIDGLILQERGLRATFLPSVWEQLSSKEEFLQHLKLKAGLPADYWSDTMQFSSYKSSSFSTGTDIC